MKRQSFHFELQDLIIQFLAAFDDIVIKRYNKNRLVADTIQARILYAPKQRVLHDIITPGQNITLPVVSVGVKGINWAKDRVFNKLEGFDIKERINDITQLRKIPSPIPIDINMNMSIITRYQLDMDQIISNFTPFLNPYIVVSWKIPSSFNTNGINEIRSIIKWSGDTSIAYPFEVTAKDKSLITADTTFTIEGWLFPDFEISPGEIYYIDSNFYATRSLSEFTISEDYNTLSATDFTGPAVTSSDVISVSGSPSVTNMFYNSGGRAIELYENFTMSNTISSNKIVLYGYSFNHTRNILLSSGNSSLYGTLTTLDYEYFPSLSGAVLPSENWDIITNSVMTVTIPSLSATDRFNIIIENKAGWTSSFEASDGYLNVML